MGVRVAVIAGVVVGAITVTHHHTATHLTLTLTAFGLQISKQVSHLALHAQIVHGHVRHHTVQHHMIQHHLCSSNSCCPVWPDKY